MIKILAACGAGVNSSHQIKSALEEELSNRGYDVHCDAVRIYKEKSIHKNLIQLRMLQLQFLIKTISVVNQLLTILISCQKLEQQAEPRHY
ncbi:PTS system galactose-specific transporter subunit IIB [Streptococcus pneumoniae]|nr:PTS system galactose-specific transporter subunit IIB [Streptococcus pneumoniae]